MPGMPGFDPLDPTANLIRSGGMSVKMVDAYGRTESVRYSNLGAQDLAVGENTRLVEAVGAASNMGAYGWDDDRINRILIIDAEVFDETWPDASNVLYLTFTNNEGRTTNVEVPAPKAVLFEGDGVTLTPLPADAANDTPEQAIIRELIDASKNVINTSYAPINSYDFTRGIRRTRKKALPSGSNARPTVVDPGANTGTGAG